MSTPLPLKLMHSDPATSATAASSSLLLRLWHVVRSPLFPFLTTSDCIALLGTSELLRQDVDIIERVSAVVHSHTQCFFRGCVADWCDCEGPVVNFESWDDYHHKRRLLCYTHQTHAGFEETRRAWEAKLGSRERSISLLSLAWLMASELEPILYLTSRASVRLYIFVPFISPLSYLEEIKRQYQRGGPASACGFHIDNVALSANGHDVQCAFCEALQSVDREVQEYNEPYENEPQVFEQKLRDDGLDSEMDEFHERMEDFYETRAEYNEQYDYDYARDNLGSMAAARSKDGRLPPLNLVGTADDDEELNTGAWDVFYDTMFLGDNAQLGVCESYLRPLVAFFHRNGFGRVHRATLGHDELKFDDCPDDEIRRVEMVGAEAPHGFFAGVYIVERYT